MLLTLVRQSRGYIFLMSVLIVGTMLMATSMSLLLLSWASEQNGVTFAESARALILARSCAEQAIPKLRASLTYAGETLTFFGGSCRVVSVQGQGAFDRTICSEGMSGEVTRRMRMDIQELFPTVVITNYTEIDGLDECGGVAELTAVDEEEDTGSGSSSSMMSSSSSSQVSIASNSTLVVFDISATSSILPLAGLQPNGAIAIAISGTSALLAGATASEQLQVLDVTDPRVLVVTQEKPGDTEGLAVVQGRDQVIMGSKRTTGAGGGNGEFRLWRSYTGQITSAGPWDFTTSGSALKIAADPTGCYAFAVSDWQTKGLHVVKVRNEAMTTVSSFLVSSSTLGTPTSLWHDPASDRVYLVSTKGFTILGPSSSSPSCP